MKASDISTEKQRLRRAMRLRLAQVTPSEANAAGVSIAEHLVHTDLWRLASRVALFASRADEADMSPLAERALTDAKPVLLPRILTTGTLEFASLHPHVGLLEGRFGVLEPPEDSPGLELTSDDLVLVPGLAFDRQGGRLGRGRGYYDRGLAIRRESESGPLLIGVGFAFQLVERVPMTALDVRLDGLVSELGLIGTEGSRQWFTRVLARQGRLDRDD